MHHRLLEEFLPSTFAERGVAVPFTTPLLNQARLRVDRNEKFEFLMPNFTGGRGVYVMPWKALPSVMTVTLHDRLLYEEIEKLENHSPETIRVASLKVQATGVAGPDAAAAAKRAMLEEAHYLTLTQFILVTEMLRLVGIGAQDLLRAGMTAEQSKKLARDALARVAGIVKMPPDELTNRVEGLGAVATPVGIPQSPQPGRLRDLAQRLEQFVNGCESFADTDLSDAAQLGRYVAEVAKHTLALGRDRLGQYDRLWTDLRTMVKDDTRCRAIINEHIARLSWLMDRWDFLINLWEDACTRSTEAQQSTIAEISRLVPVLPKEELGMKYEGFDAEALARVQRRWVRVNEDWRTGALDMDAVMRVEQMKTAVH